MIKRKRDRVTLCREYKAFRSSLRSCFEEKPRLKMRGRKEREGEMQNGFRRRGEEEREMWG